MDVEEGTGDARGSMNATEVFLTAVEKGGLKALAKAVAARVASWLSDHELPSNSAEDVWYKTWLDHYDCPIGGAVALVICVDGFSIFEDLELPYSSEWSDFLGSMCLHYELYGGGEIVIYASENRLVAAIEAAFDFEWASRLVAPDYSKIYREAFAYFSRNYSDLSKLHWRQFEEFLASIFLKHGYRTSLGPGRADEGVDLRLVVNSVLGELVTIVQVKRYKKPITLEQVAALSGVMHDQNADFGIYVTTSRFLPSAKRFAQRQERSINLATPAEVGLWCEAISDMKTTAEWTRQCLAEFTPDRDRIVYARDGVTMIYHKFAYVVTETPSAAMLLTLSSSRLPGDRPWDLSIGYEVPDITKPINVNAKTLTARVKGDGYWGDDAKYYTKWNGQPLWFDLND